MPAPQAIAPLLAHRLTQDPGAPFITWYDDTTGERVELSATTYANWVAKTANLLADEFMLEPGDTVVLDLPAHWLVPVFLAAAWHVGVSVGADPGLRADLVVTGPEPGRDGGGGTVPVLACSLRPFAVRFPDGPPQGTEDYGVLWPGQPDALMVSACADPQAVALRSADGILTQGDLIASAGAADWSGTRLLTDVPVLDDPAGTLVAAMLRNGSLVLVHDASPTSWTSRSSEERATDVRRRDPAAQPSAE